MDNKRIAKHALQFIGGKPAVNRYYNQDETKQVDILTSDTGVIKGVPTCSTIGLAQTDIGMVSNGKKIRVELMAVCELGKDVLGNILSTLAFDVMDLQYCAPGMVIPNVISLYDGKTALKHVVLMSPVFWPEYAPIEGDGEVVVWLMAVPITDAEKKYIEANGPAAFDKLLEEKEADVISMKRLSIV